MAVDGTIDGVQTPPEVSYIICATQRCGSTLLCEGLGGTGVAGRPTEFFISWFFAEYEPERRAERALLKDWLLPPDEYLRKVFREGTTPNGVFGVKIMQSYLDCVVTNLRALLGLDSEEPSTVLASTFPGLKYVHISRRDKIRQAISMVKAVQTGRWADIEEWVFEEPSEAIAAHPIFGSVAAMRRHLSRSDEDNIRYDFDQIDHEYQRLNREDAIWASFLASVAPDHSKVFYEDLVDAYEKTVLAIIDALSIPRPEDLKCAKRALKRQADSISDEWAERFRNELATRRPARSDPRSVQSRGTR